MTTHTLYNNTIYRLWPSDHYLIEVPHSKAEDMVAREGRGLVQSSRRRRLRVLGTPRSLSVPCPRVTTVASKESDILRLWAMEEASAQLPRGRCWWLPDPFTVNVGYEAGLPLPVAWDVFSSSEKQQEEAILALQLPTGISGLQSPSLVPGILQSHGGKSGRFLWAGELRQKNHEWNLFQSIRISHAIVLLAHLIWGCIFQEVLSLHKADENSWKRAGCPQDLKNLPEHDN